VQLPLRRNQRLLAQLLADTDALHLANSAAAYEWDAYVNGALFVEQSAGAVLALSYNPKTEALADLPVGRRFTLVVSNGTGGALTISFDSSFKADGAVLAAGELGSWQFMVAPGAWTLAKIVQVGDKAQF
jgi:hypothetical protein